MDEERSQMSPIPEELYSEYEGRPFLCCTRCGERLEDFQEGYKVSKIFKRGEVIFEYALCFPCMEGMMKESSEESQQRMAAFQEERLRPDVVGTDECVMCDRTRSSLSPQEFALVAGCQSRYLLESHLICIHCMDEMSALVSEKTRNQWNRFVEENFPGVPPDFAPIPSDGTPIPLLG